MADPLTIPAFLAMRLKQRRVECGFGIVGDYALRLFSDLFDEGFPIHVTEDEQGAAFAADAYARLRGLGVVAVTYGVGGLKVANAVAGAWAENVPLLVVSGAPGVKEAATDALLHHRIKNFDTQLRVFRDLTQAQAVLDNPATAADEIDRVITEVLSHQRPGYIEIPRDMVEVPLEPPRHGVRRDRTSRCARSCGSTRPRGAAAREQAPPPRRGATPVPGSGSARRRPGRVRAPG